MSKVNAGQASSTLIPKYIGSDFDKVVSVADNIEQVVVVSDNIEDVGTVADNINYVKEVAEDLHGMPVTMYTGENPPVLNPMPEGVMWYCTTDGRTYVWYTDADSGQWVESAPQSAMKDEATNIFFHSVPSNVNPAYRSATLFSTPAPEAEISVAHNALNTPVVQAQFIREEALWVDVSVTGAQGIVTLMGYSSGNSQLKAEIITWKNGAEGTSLGASQWVTLPRQPSVVSLPVTLVNIDVLDAGDSYVVRLTSQMNAGGSAVSTILVDGNTSSRFGIIFNTNLIGLNDGIRDGVTTSAPTENAVYDALRLKVGKSQLLQSGNITSTANWANVPAYSDSELGGSDGPLNAQAKALTARSELLLTDVREALRRSYAEAGYNLVDGSFEAGGALVNANDVLLQERTGKAFSGPAGPVAAGTDPASVGFVDKSGGLLRHELATSNGATKVGTSDGGSVQDFIDSLDAVYSRVFDSRQSMINYSEHAIGSTYSVSGEKIETFKVVDYISDVDLGGGLYASKIARSAGMTISDLPSPFFIAHQGGVLIYPSHSMEAYVGCESIGVMAVEEDCHKLLDGALACHHDNTVDKTTNGTGKVIDFSSMGWKGLKIDAQNWFGGDVFTDLDTVTLGQVFSEIGNRMVHVPEAKSADSGQAVVNEIIKYGLERSSIVQASSTSNLDAAIAQGIPAMLISSALTPQQMIDYGIEYVGLGTFESDSTILSYVNAGIKVVMYTPNRHVDRDRYDALGVSGYFSDDPLYISKEGYRLTSDPFKNKTYYHGHLGNNFDISTRGYFQNGGWGFPVRAVSKNFVLQGWGCPIENAGGSYTIAGSITFDDSTVGSDSANIAFAALTDANFQDAAASTNACYHAIFRTSGLFILYRMEGSTYTSLGSTQMAAITTGDTITFTIDVTPSSIVITRTDIAAPNQHSTNDTTYRGGYFHFGRNTAGVTFKDISIT